MGENPDICHLGLLGEKEDGKIKPELEWGSSVAWTVKPLGSISSTGKLFPCSPVEQTLCKRRANWAESGASEGWTFKLMCLPQDSKFLPSIKLLGQHPEAAEGVQFLLGVPEKALWVASGSEESDFKCWESEVSLCPEHFG